MAQVSTGTSNRLSAGYFNSSPAIIFIIFKTADANVIKTVDQIYDLMPELHRLLPADVELHVLNDRTKTIRASIFDIQKTLIASILLVMVVVFVFLRRGVPTLAAGVAVPLSLAGTVGLMWLSKYSLDNMSLLALTICVGFVVDDAIVVIENCYRNMEAGLKPLQAALEGSRQIGFTIISISISLVAAFIPLLFMGGVIGKLFREFAWTLTYAILISAVISLTLTPMICGRLIRRLPRPRETWLDRRIEPFFEGLLRRYERSLVLALRHRVLMVSITLTSVVLTVLLFQNASRRARAAGRHRPRDRLRAGRAGNFLRRAGGSSEKDQRDCRARPRRRWGRGFHRRNLRFRLRQSGPFLHGAKAASRTDNACASRSSHACVKSFPSFRAWISPCSQARSSNSEHGNRGRNIK